MKTIPCYTIVLNISYDTNYTLIIQQTKLFELYIHSYLIDLFPKFEQSFILDIKL